MEISRNLLIQPKLVDIINEARLNKVVVIQDEKTQNTQMMDTRNWLFSVTCSPDDRLYNDYKLINMMRC